jgi:outer membrane protein TolC
MKHLKISILLLFLLFQVKVAKPQQVFSLDDAISIAIEKNYGLQISKNDIIIAENKATLGNAGLLPSIDINASGSISNLATKVVFTGSIPSEESEAAQSGTLSASLDLSYTLFDGFKNKYRLQTLHSDVLQGRLSYVASIEKTIMDVVNSYYNCVKIQADLQIDMETFEYSVIKYEDVSNEVKYGQNTKLELLTNQGYVMSDTSRVLNTQLQFKKAILDLNNVLGIDTLVGNEIFESVIVLKKDIVKNALKEKMLVNNIDIRIENTSLYDSDLEVKSNKYFYLPKVSLNASYGYNNMEYEIGAMLLNRTLGPTFGFSVKQNVFAGDTKKKDTQNAKISYENAQLSYNETKFSLSQDFEKAWADYQYYLNIIPLEQINITIAKNRFEKSQSQNKLGQLSSLELRDAQLNLNIAKTTLYEAMIDAKIAEWELMRLSGLFSTDK